MKAARAGRRFLVFAGTVLALLAVVALGVPLLVSGEALRERALQAAREATGADLELGEAKLTVLPRLAVRLRAGRIAGTGPQLRAARGEDWGIATYLAEFDQVEARVSLRPLLSRRLQVGEVRVSGPRLELVRDGRRTVVEGYRLVLTDLDLGFALPAPAADAPPGEHIPEDLACRAEVTIASLQADGAIYADVAAAAELDGRVLEVPRAEARLGDGRLSGSATVDWARDPWGELVFAWRAEGVPAGDLLGPWAPELARRLEGRLEASGSGSCRLQDAEAVRSSLDLTGTAAAGEGVLHAAAWLEDVSPYLGNRQDLKDIRFRSLDHAFRIEQGRYVVQDLVIDGLDTDWRASGAVGLDGSLDLAVQVKLPPGFTPDLGQWSFLADTLRDRDGRVQLDLVLGGRAEQPSVGLDLSRLKAGASEQGADAVKKGVGRLLDKWKSK